MPRDSARFFLQSLRHRPFSVRSALVFVPLFVLGACGGSPETAPDENDADGSGATSSTGGDSNGAGGGFQIGSGGGSSTGSTSNGDLCESDSPPPECDFEASGPGCGDGEINQAEEECDDGNGLPGDGCSGTCRVEPNWSCEGGTCVFSIVCGDGEVQGSEACDDGNRTDGDGCSATCTSVDPNFLCPPDGGACVSTVVCDDGRISGSETCEDGNTTPGDGCSASCQVEIGWYCPALNQPCQRVPFCGDGVQAPSEECDDGNTVSSDGCDSYCTIESGHACPTPGVLCTPIVVACGDGNVSGAETCDDGNRTSGDGCSSVCQAEAGFSCGAAGQRCVAICGDGLVRGRETCDDGGRQNGDGCSSACLWEPGFACNAAPPHNCALDTCGNGTLGNGEACDDGNRTPGDGCAPDCTAEPSCATYGANGCTSRCGDGLVIGEECDDGNRQNGDGCSSTCQREVGFTCSQPTGCGEYLGRDHDNDPGTPTVPTCVMRIPIIYRDFDQNHPHMEPGWNSSGTSGLVGLNLDSQGKPVWSGVSDGVINSGNSAQFANWYRNSSQSTTVTDELILWDNGSGGFVNRWGPQGQRWRISSYQNLRWCSNSSNQCGACGTLGANEVCLGTCTPWNNTSTCAGVLSATEYDGNPVFYPLDGRGRSPSGEYEYAGIAPDYGGNWDAESNYVPGAVRHNFHFTSEVRRWFQYDSSRTLTLDFTGDDDVWVFINGRRAVDLGGWHPPQNGSVSIGPATAATYNLVNGRVYEIVVFQAERKKTGSTYRLTIAGFNTNPSSCSSTCGDGVVASDEQCDDGVNDGGYGQCQPGCVLGPRCGDGVVNDGEQCDSGANLSGYNDGSPTACAPGCVRPSRCGDGVVNFGFGEVCDAGAGNGSGYGQCTTSCQLGARCGDGVVNGGEQCDDGVNDGLAGCGPGCVITIACGNGRVEGSEQCDDGVNDGGYGECGPGCFLGPRCGNQVVESSFGETCDDGVNDGRYGGCTNNCRYGPYCGDGLVNGAEKCDDGENDGGYGECAPGCRIGPYCGDGIVQATHEQCDDGNRRSLDGCSSSCLRETIIK